MVAARRPRARKSGLTPGGRPLPPCLVRGGPAWPRPCLAAGRSDNELHKQGSVISSRAGRGEEAGPRAEAPGRFPQAPGLCTEASGSSPRSRGAPAGGGAGPALGGALILPHSHQDYVFSEDLMKISVFSSCGGRAGEGCWGPVVSPRRRSGQVPGAEACSGLPRWTVAMATPALGCGKHRLSKGALFPVGALQSQPAGAVQTWGGKGGVGGRREEMSLGFPSSPLPQACFLEAPVSKAPVSGE